MASGEWEFIRIAHLSLNMLCEKDPLEQTNLSGNPGCRRVEQELSQALGEFMASTNDPILQGEIERPPAEKAQLDRYFVVCEQHLMNENARPPG